MHGDTDWFIVARLLSDDWSKSRRTANLSLEDTDSGIIQASYESYRVWWLGYQNTFSPRFRKHMDDIMAATPVNPEPYFLNMECDTPVGKDYWREY